MDFRCFILYFRCSYMFTFTLVLFFFCRFVSADFLWLNLYNFTNFIGKWLQERTVHGTLLFYKHLLCDPLAHPQREKRKNKYITLCNYVVMLSRHNLAHSFRGQERFRYEGLNYYNL